MLNSAEHEILNDHKYKNVKKLSIFFQAQMISLKCYCNVCETLICKLVYLFNVFDEHGKYIGNMNHLW